MKNIVFQLMFIVRHQSHLPVSIVTTPQLPSNTIFDGVPTFDVDVWWTPARASPPFLQQRRLSFPIAIPEIDR